MHRALTDDVGYLLVRATAALVRRTNLALVDHGLRVRQYAVLSLAAHAATGIAQRDVAETLGLDPSQVVLLVDELDNAGLVERRLAPSDRRSRLVVPTPAGLALAQEAATSAATAADEGLALLSSQERLRLLDMLTRIQLTV